LQYRTTFGRRRAPVRLVMTTSRSWITAAENPSRNLSEKDIAMGIVNEFKEFAMRGNVIDLAVGVIIGAAFAPIVSTLVDNIIMPPIGYLMAGIDFSNLAIAIPTPTEPVLIKYGIFLNALVKFLITAFAIFLLIKLINVIQKPKPAPPPGPTPTEVYLKEIRDLLEKRAA
jgi:large conductance mechanosensitive channel